MRNVFIVVEGYTELEFIKSLVAPYLIDRGANGVIPFPVATNSNAGKKGGGNNYEHLKKELLRSVRYNPDKIVTTFFDYYAFPQNSPRYELCRQKPAIDERISCLEAAIKEDIALNNHYFIPYIQKHEFEALLFSSNNGFESYFDQSISSETERIIAQYENPEEINDNTHTAPSKRILNINPAYNKVIDGNIIALEIGIERMIEKCPRFKNWIETIVEKVNV